MNINQLSIARTALAVSLPILISACSLTDPRRVEEDFGKSVRQMVQAQIYDPQIAADPAILGPDLLDGGAGVDSIDGYGKAGKSARNQTITPDSAVDTK